MYSGEETRETDVKVEVVMKGWMDGWIVAQWPLCCLSGAELASLGGLGVRR